MIRSTPSLNRRRRGAVLIVVLAMLVLFAVLGLSFVLYAESRASAARSNVIAENRETEPDPQAAAQLFTGNWIYDVGDFGDDLMNPIRSHSLARSKYGYQSGLAGLLPFAGTPIPQEPGAFNYNGILDSRQIVRFTWDNASNKVFDPERFYNGAPLRNNPTAALSGNYAGKNYAYTYPDRHDFYLAYQNPTTGEIVLPSFHRPDLGSWNPNAGAAYFENQPGGKFKTLRPRKVEHPNFPAVPLNADGSYTGDVQNMKFTGGVQKNDSLWMDAGGPVLRWRGKNYKAMVAPLILDLSGRVNLSIAGNLKAGPDMSGNFSTASNQGLGAWEIDPAQLGLTSAELQSLIQRRQASLITPAPDPYTGLTSSKRINQGQLAPQISSLDPDAVGPTMSDGPMVLPQSGGYTLFPQFNQAAATPPRYPNTSALLTTELANHPSQFNPLTMPRGQTGVASGYGLDDLVKVYSRVSDPKGRPGLSRLLQPPTNNIPTTTTTTFSTSQQWGSAEVNTALDGSTKARLGPIDLNRALPDFRKNPTVAASPLNQWGTGSAEYAAARAARQNLARDVFVRLLAASGYFANGSGAGANSYLTYDTLTGYPIYSTANPATDAQFPFVRDLAQLAANVVDYIDPDDVSTVFAFRPKDATLPDPSADTNNFGADVGDRSVFGTEIPRLVLNEVYSSVHNDRMETHPGMKAQKAAAQKYWIELYNPMPSDSNRSDSGAARLQYSATSQVPDQTGALANAGVTYNPYRIDIAKTTPPGGGGARDAYSKFLQSTNYAGAAADLTPVPNVTLYSQVNNFSDAPGADNPATLVGDDLLLVKPLGSGTPSGNDGYYLLGPKDQHPSKTVKNTLNIGDGTAPNAVDALSITFGPMPPDDPDTTTEQSIVILRRLANPYLPPQATPGPTYNPYITVDYLEYIPTRDRMEYRKGGAGTPDNNGQSVGRKHPFAAHPYLTQGTASDSIAVQVATVNTTKPPHTFFEANSNKDNIRANNLGFEWLVHLDRELISPAELLQVSGTSPALLTQKFYSNTNVYQQHMLSENFGNSVFGLGLTASAGSTLGRTFGHLTIGGRVPGEALGGRTAGRVNLNTVNDKLILRALLSPQGGNVFSLADVDTLWSQLSGSGQPYARNAGAVPAATVAEGGSDRPIVGFATSTNPDDTLARANSGTRLFSSPTQLHAYLKDEMIRKAWNNLTPTSDSFLVLMTVGFFEVDNPGPWSVTNQPQLGKELFDKVPGDLRTQFAGVVDRSCLGLADPAASTVPSANVPFQTKLTADVSAGATSIEIEAVCSEPPPSMAPLRTLPDGTTVPLGCCVVISEGRYLFISDATATIPATLPANGFNTTRLRVGYGDSLSPTNPSDGEWLNVLSTTIGSKPGTALITLSTPVTRFHGGSTLVSDIVFGNPGPQPGVTLKQLQQRGIVPYFTRIDP